MIIAEMFDFKNSPTDIAFGSARITNRITKTYPTLGEFELVIIL
jgi:hypothetical protein